MSKKIEKAMAQFEAATENMAGVMLAELKAADKKIAELESALRFAAGMISTMKEHEHKHPQYVYDYIVAEGKALKGGGDGTV